jgi:hypothetical protein
VSNRQLKLFVMVAVALVSTIMYGKFFLEHNKIYSAWNWFGLQMPPLLVGLILSVLVVGMVISTGWYKHGKSLHELVMSGVVIGLLITLYGGVYMTEPIEPGARTSAAGMQLAATDPEYHHRGYVTSRSGSYIYYHYYNTSSYGNSGFGSFELPDCDDEACGYLMIAIIVIVIVLSSLIIPHFWVAGGLLLVILLWALAYREYALEANWGYSY